MIVVRIVTTVHDREVGLDARDLALEDVPVDVDARVSGECSQRTKDPLELLLGVLDHVRQAFLHGSIDGDAPAAQSDETYDCRREPVDERLPLAAHHELRREPGHDRLAEDVGLEVERPVEPGPVPTHRVAGVLLLAHDREDAHAGGEALQRLR